MHFQLQFTCAVRGPGVRFLPFPAKNIKRNFNLTPFGSLAIERQPLSISDSNCHGFAYAHANRSYNSALSRGENRLVISVLNLVAVIVPSIYVEAELLLLRILELNLELEVECISVLYVDRLPPEAQELPSLV